jgi:preprotein translocase subunit SecY
MESQHDSQRSIVRISVVTILALVAVQVLLLIPIVGLQRGAMLGDQGLNARYSIAAIGVAVWTMSAILVQLAMLVMRASWNRHLGRSGLVNPFGWAALGLTALLLYGYASGVAGSLQTNALIADTQQGMMLVIASLYLGTAGIVIAAWVIDRFGIGHGFWIVFAASGLSDLTTAFNQAASVISMEGHFNAFGSFASTAAIMAVVAALTLLILQNGGRFEFVAWPLLLAGLFEMQSLRKDMPEILVVVVPLSVLLVALFSFALLRRVGLMRLLLPLAGTLAVIAVLELWLIGTFSRLMLPLPAGLLVVCAAVLTTLWYDWQRRSAVTPVIEEHS